MTRRARSACLVRLCSKAGLLKKPVKKIRVAAAAAVDVAEIAADAMAVAAVVEIAVDAAETVAEIAIEDSAS